MVIFLFASLAAVSAHERPAVKEKPVDLAHARRA
jgi:hypothetical protein